MDLLPGITRQLDTADVQNQKKNVYGIDVDGPIQIHGDYTVATTWTETCTTGIILIPFTNKDEQCRGPSSNS